MAYDLEAFCAECRRHLAGGAGPEAKEAIRVALERLLANPDFVAAHCGPDAPVGRHTLHEDPELGFCVLAHVNDAPRRSPPHDHGHSWAVYGQASGHTDMTEYRRADGGSGPGPARLEVVRRYRLEPGRAGVYDVGAIHQIDYPAGARFVRVTGTDLDAVPRLKYDLEAGRAIEMAGATVGSA